jgi:hypothetical protein
VYATVAAHVCSVSCIFFETGAAASIAVCISTRKIGRKGSSGETAIKVSFMREEMAWKRNWSEENFEAVCYLTQFLTKAFDGRLKTCILDFQDAVQM